MFAFVSAFPKSLHCTDEAQQAETVLSAVLSIYIYIIRKEGSQNKLQVEKNPRRARVRAETRTCGTDSPSRSNQMEPSFFEDGAMA